MREVDINMADVHPSAAVGYSTNAEVYVKGRPDYPQEVDQWLRLRLGLREGKSVLDLGAGTGKFSKRLSSTGARVTALDPVAAMLEQLSKEQPGIETKLGSAESMPLESNSLNTVVCAQSFHWFATAAALAEIRRVLKPGGQLGLIWNVRDESVGWVAALTKLIAPFEGDTPRYRTQEWRSVFPAEGFSQLHEERFLNEHVGPSEQVIIDRILSVSFIAALGGEERSIVESQLRQMIDSTPELAGRASIKFPYETVTFSCAKVS